MATELPIVAMFLVLNSFAAETTINGGMCAGTTIECTERFATMDECVKLAEQHKIGQLRFFCVDTRDLVDK